MNRSLRSQSGVAMLITLIALVILLISAMAMIRSADTTSVIAGNLAFKRDLTNNAERAVAVVMARFSTGDLSAMGSAYTSVQADNYSATMLTTTLSNEGLPDALLNDTTFATVGTAGNDITDATSGITIRYLVDRLCTQAGAPTPATCQLNIQFNPQTGTSGLRKPNAGYAAVYRLSIRVNGPRNTQAFVQTTLSY